MCITQNDYSCKVSQVFHYILWTSTTTTIIKNSISQWKKISHRAVNRQYTTFFFALTYYHDVYIYIVQCKEK